MSKIHPFAKKFWQAYITDNNKLSMEQIADIEIRKWLEGKVEDLKHAKKLPFDNELTLRVYEILELNGKLEWCEHIKHLDGRWRQTGPTHKSVDVTDIWEWENLCSICGAKRP